jgi:hypothetical protein
MQSAGPIKSSEVRARLEAKRDEVNLLLPTVTPSVGIASVEHDANSRYFLRIGEKIQIRLSAFANFWVFLDSNGRDNFIGCGSLNDAIINALPDHARAELRRKLNAG